MILKKILERSCKDLCKDLPWVQNLILKDLWPEPWRILIKILHKTLMKILKDLLRSLEDNFSRESNCVAFLQCSFWVRIHIKEIGNLCCVLSYFTCMLGALNLQLGNIPPVVFLRALLTFQLFTLPSQFKFKLSWSPSQKCQTSFSLLSEGKNDHMTHAS